MTVRKRLARQRQRETGEKYTQALRWVDAHIEELSAQHKAQLKRYRDERDAKVSAPLPTPLPQNAEPPDASGEPDPPAADSATEIRFSHRSPTDDVD